MHVRVTRRDILRTTATLVAAGALGSRRVADAQPGPEAFGHIDDVLRTATTKGDLPGVVAMAATDRGIVYEGAFGTRRLPDGLPMTRDTVFRIASMVKLLTHWHALSKISFDDAPINRGERMQVLKRR